MRWHVNHGTLGTGHLYQGRFKAFPVEENEHLYAVLRYAERNAMRANFVDRVEAWRWGSAWYKLIDTHRFFQILDGSDAQIVLSLIEG